MEEQFLKRAIENELMKKPSVKFTDNVMDSIFEIKTASETKPLISKSVWACVAIFLVGIVAFIFFANPASSSRTHAPILGQIGSLISTIKLPPVDIYNQISWYVVAGACLAIVFLTVFDVVLFRQK